MCNINNIGMHKIMKALPDRLLKKTENLQEEQLMIKIKPKTKLINFLSSV